MKQRRFPTGAVTAECESLVRAAISAQAENAMVELGANGKFIHLVRERIEHSCLEINRQLARSCTQLGHSHAVAARLHKLNECLTPFVGEMLLRCGIWWAGVRHEFYIDEKHRRIVHHSSSPSPEPDQR